MRIVIEQLEPRLLLSASAGGLTLATAYSLPLATVQAVSPSADSPPSGALTPSQMRSAYGFDQVMFGSIAGTGSGQTVAIIDAYDDPTALNDLNQFSVQFGLPQFNSGGPTFTKVGENGGAVPGTDPNGPTGTTGTISWEVEESLDIEWVHAMAPQANIILVEASSDMDYDLIQKAVRWATFQSSVTAVSMSFAGTEFSAETSYDSYFLTPNGHAGITFFSSAGDAGEPAGYPAFSPNVVGVGGTALTLDGNGNYVSESGWSHTGGGISLYENQPSYQSGVVTQSTARRTAPDVAMDATTGVAVYDSYDYPGSPWVQEGATSLSAPLWAGLMAVVDQGRVLAGLSTLNGLTQTLPALYKLPADFHDVTSGNNGYQAGAGYDLVTGLGTPVANKLIPDLVNLGRATQLVFTQQPAGAIAGNVIDGPGGVQVTVEDPTGAAVTTDNSTVTLTLSNGTFAGGGTIVTANVVNGVATFNSLVIDAAGSYTLAASDGALAGAASGSFGIGAASAAQLAFTQQPAGGTAGVTLDPAFAVTVEDSFGNTIATDSSSVTITLSSGTFASGGTTATAGAVSGVADFGSLVIDGAGSYTLTAGDGSLTGAASGTFTIVAAAAAKLAFTKQPAGGTAGVTLGPAFAVTVEDSFGNTIATDSSSVTLTLSGGTFAGGGTTATAGAVSGVATFANLIIDTAGGYTLAAGDDPLTGAGSGSFTVGAAAAAQLAFEQPPVGGTAGAALSPAVTVAVQDPFGNTVTSDISTVTLTLSGGTFAGGGTTATAADVNGIAAFGSLIIDVAGDYSLAAGDGVLAGDSSGSFSLVAAAAAKLGFVQQPTNTKDGAAIAPAVTVAILDSFGNTVTTDISSVMLTLSSGTFASGGNTATASAAGGIATFDSLIVDSAGSYTLTAGDGALTGDTSGSFKYLAPPTVAGVSPSKGPAGSGTQVTITGANLTGATAVDFGGTPADSFVVDSDTQITATSPAGSAGAVDVTVVGVGGTSVATSADQFTYVAAPVVAAGAGALSYLQGAAPGAVDPGITVSDAGGATLAGATVTISGNYVVGQDVLGFANQNEITGSWNAATGVLTLSGSSSLANYQAALRSVTYIDTSANPSTLSRTVSFVADDGFSANNLSAAALQTVTVTRRSYVDLTGVFGTLWTLPSSVVGGKALAGYTSVIVKNIGNMALPVGQLVNIQVVAHDTTNPANPDITLVTLANQSVSALAADGTRQFNLYVNKTTGLPADAYQILANITPVHALAESRTDNNQASQTAAGATKTVAAATPFVDLTAQFGANMILPAQVTSGDGRQIYVPVVVKNIGNVALPAGQKINIAIDADYATTTTLLKTLAGLSVSSLGAGASATFATYVTLPITLGSAIWPLDQYKLVAVADSTDLVTGDIRRANNTVTSAGAISVFQGSMDLFGKFGTLWTLPSSIAAGKALAGYASVVVSNQGNLALPAGQLVNIVVTAHDTTNTGNPVIMLATLANQSVSALAAGGTRQFNVYVNRAAGLSSDHYQIEATITPVQLQAGPTLNNYTVLTNALGNTLGITVI